MNKKGKVLNIQILPEAVYRLESMFLLTAVKLSRGKDRWSFICGIKYSFKTQNHFIFVPTVPTITVVNI